MSTVPTSQNEPRRASKAFPRAGRAEFGQGSASALSMKWSALHDAAGAVALLAGQEPQGMSPEIRNFPAVMRDAGGWRRDLAEQGIADLSAVLEPGLSALLAVHARGTLPQSAALALWQEFLAARDTMLSLSPPRGEFGHKRLA